MKLTSILPFLLLGVLALGFAGCESTSDDDNSPTGPANSAAFAGSSISFNPAVAFAAGDNLTYTNTETGTQFPVANIPMAGTYTYVPNASFTEGTLTLTVGADVIVLELSDFVHDADNNITGFTARSSRQSYPVTVTGTLPAHVPGTGGGGLGEGQTRADDIPTSMRGSHVLVFFPGTSTTSGLPSAGESTTFVVEARSLTFNSRTLTDPVFFGTDTSEWLFKDGALTYGVSAPSSGGSIEINLYGPIEASGPTTSYGQYRAATIVVPPDDEQPPTGSFPATATAVNTPISFPTSDSYTLGQSVTFTLTPTNLSVDGAVYTFVDSDLPSGSGTRLFTYSRAVGTFTDTAVVSVSSTDSSTPTRFVITRTRDAVSPATGTVEATFTFTPSGG